MSPAGVAPAPPLPMVGRASEWTVLRQALDRAVEGRGSAVLLRGPEGSGRSRLCAAAREEAERRDFLVASGSAYPLESGVPYGLFCDLLEPGLRALSAEARVALTRGSPEFSLLCPALAEAQLSLGARDATGAGVSEAARKDLRSRLLWNFFGFLDRMRKDQPALFIFEDVEWADPSSLELLHFLARHMEGHPLVLLVTLDPHRPGQSDPGAAGVDVSPAAQLARGLAGREGVTFLDPAPLDADDVERAVADGFGVAPEVVRPLARSLHQWTGGIPLYLTASLDHLVAEGQIRRVGEQWTGWTLSDPHPPGSLRSLVLARLRPLSPRARSVADLMAVLGARGRFSVLMDTAELDEDALLAALRELRDHRILEEEEGEEGRVFHRFQHPLMREVVYGEIGRSRARILHARVARSLEQRLGDQALVRADELAPHILEAGDEVDRGEGARYLAAAGSQALRVHADREADRLFRGALALLDSRANEGPSLERLRLRVERARALQRLGRLDDAQRLLDEALDQAQVLEDPAWEARVHRRLGLGAFRGGDPHRALEHWTAGLDAARRAGDVALEARLRLGCSACLQELGRHADAVREAREALVLAEGREDPALQVAAHRSLLLLYSWAGPPGEARDHGASALALAEEIGDPAMLVSVRWALAVLAGLTGRAAEVRAELDHAWPLVRTLDSPALHLQLAEVEIDYAAGVGEWKRASDLARESVAMARALNQRMMLPRLLVASCHLRLGRGETDEAREELDEARTLVEAGAAAGPAAVHLAVLVRSAQAALHASVGEWEEAIRVAEEGLERADQGGCTAWGIYRLLPLITEASLHNRDLDRAAVAARRLRADGERFGHTLADIWADAADALIAWLSGDVERGAERMAQAAQRLEAVDSIPNAARMRRQLAGRLADLGDREASIRELRRVHDILAGLGAEPELAKAREQFREVGARPPARTQTPGSGLLSARELEVAHLVGERRSNKSIARELGISPRTVGTHLSNIFKKLEIDSRARLGDLVRDGELEG
jgi:predicted ATPase/DNA-binding CsgD family transcriptional regulator